MKKTFWILLLLLSMESQAQIALKGMLFRPTGELGMVVKQKYSFEPMYMKEFDEKWRVRIGFAYMKLDTRMDTFPVYAVREDGSGTSVLPGYQVFHKIEMGYLFMGYDFRFIEDHKISPYIGSDLIIGGLSLDYDEYFEEYYEGSSSGAGGIMGGMRFRAGTQYNITDHWGFFAEASASGYLIAEIMFKASFDYGAGIHYVFNPD